MRKIYTVKKISTIMLIVFVFSIAFMANTKTVSADNRYSSFNDVQDSHWALKHIVKMNLRGVVTGYEDNTFAPDKSVTQLEAVLMAVRNMNVQDELLSTNISQDLPFTVPEWAREKFKKELFFALQAGLIVPAEDNFEASSNATRAWMTQLMVRMIDKDSEASLLAYQTPSFTDFADIPRWALGYINTAIKYDLISGFPDNSFRPSDSVTRAQSVALLSRSEQYLTADENSLEGKILNLSGSRLSISSNGTVKSYDITANTVVFNSNDLPCDWIELNINDTVRILFDGAKVIYVDVIQEDTSVAQISGTVLYVIPAENLIVVKDQEGDIHTKNLDPDAVCVNQSGITIDISQIQSGYQVQLGLNAEGKIINLQVSGADKNISDSGTIYAIDTEQKLIIIESKLSGFKSFQYDEYLQIIIGNQRFSTIADLQIGDEVKIKAIGSLLTDIEFVKAQQDMSISGKILLNSPEKQLLVIEQDSGIYTFSLANTVTIKIPGKVSPDIYDLAPDDMVDLQLEDGKIVSITVNNRYVQDTRSGTIFAVDATNSIITIKTDSDQLETFEVNKAARIVIDNSKNALLSDLEQDTKVEFELLDDKIIYLETCNTIKGYLASINADRNIISIKTSASKAETYILADNVDVYKEGVSRPDLYDINNNDYVELKLDDDLVSMIKVQNICIYEILRIYESSERLRVEDEDGDARNLYLDSGVDISISGISGISSPDIEDLNEGDTIRATFLGYDLIKLEVIPVVYGEITAINSYSKTISVRSFEGDLYNYEFDSGTEIIDNIQTYYSLNALATGDRVKIKENVERETRFYIMTKVSASYVSVNDDTDKVYVKKNGSYVYYYLASPVYIHSSGQSLSFRHLEKNDFIDLYIYDDRVYEIDKIY